MINISKENIDEVLSKIIREETAPKFLIVDLFCGAGGTTTGFEMAGGIAKVIACVNHDPIAIKSHWANHPHVLHFNEDIRTLDLGPLEMIVAHYRKLYPDAIIILWASLECTNFSKAKGGQPRDADSRTLADHLPRYVTALNPDYIQIENVVEFMSWGPLDKNGKPINSKNGSDWLRWRREIKSLGYKDDWTQLNSADFGAYTSRNRLFGCFAKDGLPIAWPTPTHAKKVVKGMFGELQPWKAVKHCLDFKDDGESIFNRSERGKKELVEATLKRIYAGCVKHISGGDESFLIKYNSMNQQGKVNSPSVNDPSPTIACQGRLGLAFIQKHYSGRPAGKVISVDGPAGTITTAGTQSLVQAFLMGYYGNGDNTSSMNKPAGTITTRDRFCKVWLDKQFSGKHNHSSIESPAGTLLATPKMSLVNANFILNTNFKNTSNDIDKPAPTLTASRHHPYLISNFILNPSHGGHTMSTDKPGPTIIARQDKSPLYLLQMESGVSLPIYDDDSETMICIKIFMAVYGIGDIKMRMLKVAELKKIQGFPENYILEGSQTDQKKFIGNSVHPIVPKVWIEAMNNRLLTTKMTS